MSDPEIDGAEAARVRPPPPEGRRFQPGRSGNPKGGPKRPAPRTADVEWLFAKEFTVVIDGVEEKLPLARALLLAMAHRALKGDARAASELLALHGKAEETRAAQAAARAKKAAEAQARRDREAEDAAETAEAARLPVFYLGYGPRPGMQALGLYRELPSGHWEIPRRTYDILLAAQPDLLDDADEVARSSIEECLEPPPGSPPRTGWMYAPQPT